MGWPPVAAIRCWACESSVSTTEPVRPQLLQAKSTDGGPGTVFTISGLFPRLAYRTVACE